VLFNPSLGPQRLSDMAPSGVGSLPLISAVDPCCGRFYDNKAIDLA